VSRDTTRNSNSANYQAALIGGGDIETLAWVDKVIHRLTQYPPGSWRSIDEPLDNILLVRDGFTAFVSRPLSRKLRSPPLRRRDPPGFCPRRSALAFGVSSPATSSCPAGVCLSSTEAGTILPASRMDRRSSCFESVPRPLSAPPRETPSRSWLELELRFR